LPLERGVDSCCKGRHERKAGRRTFADLRQA
jgi:hypothetical protein